MQNSIVKVSKCFNIFYTIFTQVLDKIENFEFPRNAQCLLSASLKIKALWVYVGWILDVFVKHRYSRHQQNAIKANKLSAIHALPRCDVYEPEWVVSNLRLTYSQSSVTSLLSTLKTLHIPCNRDKENARWKFHLLNWPSIPQVGA